MKERNIKAAGKAGKTEKINKLVKETNLFLN